MWLITLHFPCYIYFSFSTCICHFLVTVFITDVHLLLNSEPLLRHIGCNVKCLVVCVCKWLLKSGQLLLESYGKVLEFIFQTSGKFVVFVAGDRDEVPAATWQSETARCWVRVHVSQYTLCTLQHWISVTLLLYYNYITTVSISFISFTRHSCNIILSVVNFVLPVMYEMVGFFHLTYSQDTHVDFDAEYFKNCCFMQRCFEVVYAVSNVVSTTAMSFKCLGLFNY